MQNKRNCNADNRSMQTTAIILDQVTILLLQTKNGQSLSAVQKERKEIHIQHKDANDD